MAITYKKIASVTVGAGGAANIEFTSIPSTYTDVIAFFSVRTDRAANSSDPILLYPNASSSNLTNRYIQGSDPQASSASVTTGRVGITPASTATSSTFGNFAIYFPNYAGSTNKSFSADSVSENNATEAYTLLGANLWSSSTAISSIRIVSQTGSNFVQYSTATLYGILKA